MLHFMVRGKVLTHVAARTFMLKCAERRNMGPECYELSWDSLDSSEFARETISQLTEHELFIFVDTA